MTREDQGEVTLLFVLLWYIFLPQRCETNISRKTMDLLRKRLERLAEQKSEKIALMNKVSRLVDSITPEMLFQMGVIVYDLIEFGEVEWDSSSLALPRNCDIMSDLSNNFFLDEDMLNAFDDKVLFRLDKKSGKYFIRDIHVSPTYLEDVIIPMLTERGIEVEWHNNLDLMYHLTLRVKGEKEALENQKCQQ